MLTLIANLAKEVPSSRFVHSLIYCLADERDFGTNKNIQNIQNGGAVYRNVFSGQVDSISMRKMAMSTLIAIQSRLCKSMNLENRKEIERHLTRYLMDVSLTSTYIQSKSLMGFKLRGSKTDIVMELDGLRCREKFTCLCVVPSFREDHEMNVLTFSLLYKWIYSVYHHQKRNRYSYIRVISQISHTYKIHTDRLDCESITTETKHSGHSRIMRSKLSGNSSFIYCVLLVTLTT